MPITLGEHPDGGIVQIGVNKFGAFVRHRRGDGWQWEDVNPKTGILGLHLDGAVKLLDGPTKHNCEPPLSNTYGTGDETDDTGHDPSTGECSVSNECDQGCANYGEHSIRDGETI